MPFVQHIVEPRFLSRRSLHREDGSPLVSDGELEAVSNNTLSSALRQLASLALIANDIFVDLSKQLQDVCERSKNLQARIAIVEQRVEAFDPRKVAVPESDLTAFSQRTEHFAASRPFERNLFTPDTRPSCVKRMYESANKTPVPVMRTMDRYREDGRRSSRFFLCTPVLGRSRRRYVTDTEIETRLPAVVNELRRWTSEEALGDVTVGPDCSTRIEPNQEVEEHRLPSPEEQVQVVAHRFPAQVVAVDVSGRAFDRMSSFRRSLIQTSEDTTSSKRRTRRPRGRRRNTIAGTDQRELEQAILTASKDSEEGEPSSVVRSASTDLLRSKKDESPSDKKSHFNTLKQWGKVKLKLIRGDASSNKSSDEPTNIYEIVGAKGKKADTKHDRKQKLLENASSKSSESSSTVKLREGSIRRRALGKEDPLHSSSGNWSASSESGRASIGSSETNTATTLQPKSTTTSSNSLSHHQAPSSSVSSRRKFPNTSASSSVSEGTLTPDLVMTELVMPFPDDGETSSVYSCDTEGYYTSFHMDSGLKTLKEEDTASTPQMPLHSTTGISNGSSPRMLTAESEYELFGKGSTSTTTSSAGTVCTTLLVGDTSHAPAVPERKSSLDKPEGSQTVVAMIHKQEQISESPDSGHNTSSSPIDSTSSPPGTLNERSSEYEFSESDLEGVDRLERIRVKTTINSSRIPSMCIITPPQSDDEFLPSYVHQKSQSVPCTSSDKDKAKREVYLNQNTADSVQVNYNSLPRRLERQNSKDSETSNEAGPSKLRSQSASRVSSTRSGSLRNKIRGMSPSPTRKVISGQQLPSLQPLNSVLDKVKGAISSASNSIKMGKACSDKDSDNTLSVPVDAGDYVTIADVHNMGWAGQRPNVYHPTSNTKNAPSGTTEYVSLNELPATNACGTTDSTLSPSNSLERKRRQGARVTLDSEGKVVYSSDSLRRNKGAHSTFEPGPYVKDPLPNSSPLAHHRVTKSNIRPVISQKDGNKPLSPTSPLLGKVIIKAASKTTPMTRIASPPLAVASRPTSPKSSLSGAGRGAYVHMQSPGGGVRAEDNDEGYSADVHSPPRYVSSPPAQSHWSAPNNSTAYPKFRTLPARRPAKQGASPSYVYDDKSYPTYQSKFNTIAVSKGTTSPPTHSSHRLYPNYLRQEHLHYSPLSSPERERWKALNSNSIPVSQSYSSRSLYSSTPTKKDERNNGALHFSSTLSPIRKPKSYDENNSNHSEYYHKTNTYPHYNLADHQPTASPRSVTPDLISAPKTKMTSEEIFAAIHKSKKKLNIKTDSNVSPSASSLGNVSPASSLSRLEPEKRSVPETGSFQTKTGLGQGWSPGSNNIGNIFRPSDQHLAKQGWAYDRLGPRQQLSRNDFKRLLLQYGAKSNINVQYGNNSGRLSAVEQLRMTRQLGNMQEVRENHSTSTAAHKLLQSPRSNVAWKFSSPRTDILSSTIVEDCAEEENASNSPVNTAVKYSDPSLESSLSALIHEKELARGDVSSMKTLSTSTSQQNSVHLLPSVHCASSSKYMPSNLTQESRSPSEISKLRANHFTTTLLSSSNVKENLDTNLQHAAPSAALQAPSPRISSLLSKQWTRQCSPQQQAPSARTILGAITSTKSSPKTTLETAL